MRACACSEFLQVRKRRHRVAGKHVQNILQRPAQCGAASEEAFQGRCRVAVVWRSRRAHMEPGRRSRTLQRREVHREQGQLRRARGPSAGSGAQALGLGLSF